MSKFKYVAAAAVGIPLAAVAVKRYFALEAIDPATETLAVPYPDETPVKLAIDVPFGELDVRPGGEALLAGDVTYNVEGWGPLTQVKGGKVRVYQESRAFWGWPGRHATNQWDVRLGTAAPYKLEINTGAGESDIDLSGLPLTALEINTGAGETEIRFNAENPQTAKYAEINTGAGETHVSGLLNLAAVKVEIGAGAGETHVDFGRGALREDMTVEITGGAGEVVLSLPADLPARVEMSTGIGGKAVHGLTKHNGGYETGSYAGAATRLKVYVSVGVGHIEIEAR